MGLEQENLNFIFTPQYLWTKYLEQKIDELEILRRTRGPNRVWIFLWSRLIFYPPILRAEYWVWMCICSIIYEAPWLRVSIVMMLDTTGMVMILSFSKPDNTIPPRFYIHLFVNTENNFYDHLHNGIWFVYDSSSATTPCYERHKRLKAKFPLPPYNCNTKMVSLLFHKVTPPWVQCQVLSPGWMQFLISGLRAYQGW